MRLRGVVLSVVIVLTGIAVLLAIAALAGALGRPLRWELPPGYRGWVVVRFDDPACPPLRGSGIYLVVPVTAAGRGCTSSPVPAGWRYYRYEYVGPDGTRTVIRSSGWDASSEIWPFTAGRFFVGTKAERERSAPPQQ
jgi:hypothetical protein